MAAAVVWSRAGSTPASCAWLARSGPARGTGGLERSGELTPYEIEVLVADALRAGPGARLEMELSASTDDAGLAATRKRFAWLAGRGVAVSVQRDHRAA